MRKTRGLHERLLTRFARNLAALCMCHGVLSSAAAQLPSDAAIPGATSEAPESSPTTPTASDVPRQPVPLTPPRLLESKAPDFPPEKMASGEHPTVVLQVTVFSDGRLGDIVIEHSAGPLFDQAARSAVQAWKFEPARRGDEAVASRVGVAVHFELPQLATHEVTAVAPPSVALDHDHHGGARAPVTVNQLPQFGANAHAQGSVRSEDRGATDVRISGNLLRAAPAQDGGDLLKRAPGMVVARIEGEAVAQRVMLRGFDADHGQDVEFTVDGVPVNQPSHIHGQGYADLGFLIPETVRGLRVTEGVYDPRQGDFAVAGSADFELGVEQRGVRLISSYGSFRSFRQVALYAPRDLDPGTFGAIAFKKTRGFGDNRAATSGAAVAQMVFRAGSTKTALHASAYGSRALTANVVRRDDVRSGRVGFYDVYPLATAEAQSAAAQRLQLASHTRFQGSRGENVELTAYLVMNVFRLQANYTGYTQISRKDPSWTGRGDLIEQRNQDRSLGLTGRYRTAEQRAFAFFRGFFEVGLAGRFDQIEQAQNLIEAPENATWDERIDASIDGLDVGGYLDLDTTWFDRVHVRGGVRADVLSYQVADRLANFTPAFRQENHIAGYRRSAAGIAAGPRVALNVDILPSLTAMAAYGEGYRSPMALLLDDGEPAPFVKVRSGDVGLKVVLGPREELELRASGYATYLEDDVAFDPREGRVEPVGPTRRLGAVLYAVATPAAWVLAAASVTYVHASLRKPPYSTAEDPDPPFRKGQLLPYVPPVVIRADLNVHGGLFDVAAAPLEGRAGLGFSYWAPRPLPFSERAASVSLLDAELSVSLKPLTISMFCFNLLDTRYAALELSYASNWNPDGLPSRLPARHIMAGAPRTLFGTLEVSW